MDNKRWTGLFVALAIVAIVASYAPRNQVGAEVLPRANDGMRSAGDFEADPRVQVAAGLNFSIGTDFGTIASTVGASGLYPWRTSAAQIFSSSDNALDTGIGYVFVGIRGFDWATPFERVQGVVTLDGTNPVALDVSDIQNIIAFVIADGFAAPLGTVFVYAGSAGAVNPGVPDSVEDTLAVIENSSNFMMSAIVAAPADRRIGLKMYGASAAGKQITFRIAWRTPDANGNYGAFKQGPPGAVTDGFEPVHFDFPLDFGGPGSQLEIRAKTDVGMADVTGILSFRWLDP